MGIFRPQKYIFMSIKLFTIFSIKCYEESHKINEWKFSCDTTRPHNRHPPISKQEGKAYMKTIDRHECMQLS